MFKNCDKILQRIIPITTTGNNRVLPLFQNEPDYFDRFLHNETKLLLEKHFKTLISEVNGSSEINLLKEYHELWQGTTESLKL